MTLRSMLSNCRSRAEPRASTSPARAYASFGAGFVLLATCAWACGGGSALDEYEDGVPGVVPSPVSSSRDAGTGRDSGTGNRDAGGGAQGGGAQGGGAQGGGAQGGGVGSACTSDRNCTDDEASCETNVNFFGLLGYELKGGYCTTSGCQSDAQCPAGSGCFVLTGNCLKKCSANSQCRVADGYQCANLDGSQNLCVPGQAAMDIGSLGGLLGGIGGIGGTGGGTGGSGFLGGLLGDLGGLFGGTGGGGGPGGGGN
jgi:hypothetical protein